MIPQTQEKRPNNLHNLQSTPACPGLAVHCIHRLCAIYNMLFQVVWQAVPLEVVVADTAPLLHGLCCFIQIVSVEGLSRTMADGTS
mmetsp:Transcript_32290/g.57940  ORF Transcript_32290/g.57940 Transcript_32290/m.57940 type:complete len:86 (-) Transcript_32290:121-378(-)